MEDATEDKLDMASQEEAVALVAPGEEEEVKKVESGGEFSVNGAPNHSFNSRLSTDVVPGDVDMAASQVAVAGSVDSAAEAPVRAGAEPSASVDTGSASSNDVVDATEKVESWDLSEAVQENATNKEDSKPNFSEDGTLEDIKSQASSDLIADAPTSAADVEDPAGGVPLSFPSADVEEKAVEVSSEDAGVVSEELPAEVAVSEDVNPKLQDDGSAEKGDSEAPEPPVEEVHEVGEATTSAEPDKEVASVEAVPSPSADVEEKSIDVEDKPVDVEDKPADVEDKAADVEDKTVDVADNSGDVNSEDAGVVSEELPAEVAASEERSPKIPDEGSAEEGDSEAPEASVEEVHDAAEAATGVEPDEAAENLEAVPSPSADVEEKSVDVEDKSVDVEDKPVDVEDKPVDVADKSVDTEDKIAEVNSEDAGFVSEELPAEVPASEEVSPKIPDAGSAEKGDSEAPEASVEEVHDAAEATTGLEPAEEIPSLEAVPSSSVDVEERSVQLESEEAGAVSEDVSPNIEDEESAEKGDSEAPEPPVEEVHEVAEATTGVEPDEAVASLEAVPSPSADAEEKSVDVEDKSVDVEDKPVDVEDKTVDVAGKSVEVNSDDAGVVSDELPAEVAASEEVSPKVPDEGSAEKGDGEAPEPPLEEVHEVAEATTSTEPDEAVASLEAVPSPSVDVEEKSVEVHSEDKGTVSEDVSPKIEAEESAEKGYSEVPEALLEEVHEVAEATTSTEPDEAVASLEAVPSPSVDLDEKSVEVHSEDAGAVSEDVSPKIEDEESAEKGDSEAPEAPVEEVHEVAEATTSTEPDEAVANLEAVPSPSADLEEKSVVVHSEDAGTVSEDVRPKVEEESAETGDNESPEAPVEEDHEVAEATTSAEPDEAVTSVEAVPSPSVDVEEKSVEVDHVEPTTSAEAHEETASLESVPAPAEDVEEKSVQEVDSKDTSEASEVFPSESADKEDVSPEPAAEGAADNVGSETLYFPDEEVHEVVEATIDTEPDEVPVEPESALAPADVVEDKSVDLNSEDAIGVTTASESVDKEGVSPEPSSEATVIAGADASLESGAVEGSASLGSRVEEGSASLESVSSPATNVEDRSLEVNPEDTSEAKIELPTEIADKEDVSPEIPAEGSSDNVGSEALFTPVEEVHEVVDATIAPEPDEGSTSPESGPAPADVEEKSEDLSEETTTELPLESVDKEVASRDLPVEEVHAPIEEIGKIEDSATDAESAVQESAAVSSEDVQTIPETVPREFNFNDLKEALTTSDDVTSDDVTSEKLATAIGEEGSSSDAVASDTTPLEISSPPPAVESKEAPKSSDLHEVAVHLEDAAEKTLADVKSSVVGDRQASVAESVAQIVLDESGKTGDSSELISGVIQHVALLAQDDFQSDPNVLPDTVNQVFDRGNAGSPANEANQPKQETTSLGTKFSLFVIWCISLCASHVSSKDMPAPALKLGAEEVAAVLHSNAQGAASSKAASSV